MTKGKEGRETWDMRREGRDMRREGRSQRTEDREERRDEGQEAWDVGQEVEYRRKRTGIGGREGLSFGVGCACVAYILAG